MPAVPGGWLAGVVPSFVFPAVAGAELPCPDTAGAEVPVGGGGAVVVGTEGGAPDVGVGLFPPVVDGIEGALAPDGGGTAAPVAFGIPGADGAGAVAAEPVTLGAAAGALAEDASFAGELVLVSIGATPPSSFFAAGTAAGASLSLMGIWRPRFAP